MHAYGFGDSLHAWVLYPSPPILESLSKREILRKTLDLNGLEVKYSKIRTC